MAELLVKIGNTPNLRWQDGDVILCRTEGDTPSTFGGFVSSVTTCSW